MSVNKHKPHLLILPEDDANRQLAVGFRKTVTHTRRVQVLPEAGGWLAVCDSFAANEAAGLRSYASRHILLLLDFDNDDVARRISHVLGGVPGDLKARVFLLGVRPEPERLKAALADALERIGERLASECGAGTPGLWSHDLLQHNTDELQRLRAAVCPFLF